MPRRPEPISPLPSTPDVQRRPVPIPPREFEPTLKHRGMVSKPHDSSPQPCGCKRPRSNPRCASVPKITAKWKQPLFGNRDGGCNEQICHDLLTKTLRDLHARMGSINVSSAFSDWAIEYLRLSRNDNRVTDRPDLATHLLSFFQIQCQDAAQLPKSSRSKYGKTSISHLSHTGASSAYILLGRQVAPRSDVTNLHKDRTSTGTDHATSHRPRKPIWWAKWH